MTWRIDTTPADGATPLGVGMLGEIITAHRTFRKLSKAAKTAVLAAYPDGNVECHPLTWASLNRHGFVVGAVLTEAGKRVAYWNLPKEDR